MTGTPATVSPLTRRRAPEPLWRHLAGDVLRRERTAQGRTLKDVADRAGISMPYLSEVERGLKEASSEVLAAAAGALGLRLADLLARAYGELAPVTVLAPREVTSVTAVTAVTERAGGHSASASGMAGGVALAA